MMKVGGGGGALTCTGIQYCVPGITLILARSLGCAARIVEAVNDAEQATAY